MSEIQNCIPLKAFLQRYEAKGVELTHTCIGGSVSGFTACVHVPEPAIGQLHKSMFVAIQGGEIVTLQVTASSKVNFFVEMDLQSSKEPEDRTLADLAMAVSVEVYKLFSYTRAIVCDRIVTFDKPKATYKFGLHIHFWDDKSESGIIVGRDTAIGAAQHLQEKVKLDFFEKVVIDTHPYTNGGGCRQPGVCKVRPCCSREDCRCKANGMLVTSPGYRFHSTIFAGEVFEMHARRSCTGEKRQMVYPLSDACGCVSGTDLLHITCIRPILVRDRRERVPKVAIISKKVLATVSKQFYGPDTTLSLEDAQSLISIKEKWKNEIIRSTVLYKELTSLFLQGINVYQTNRDGEWIPFDPQNGDAKLPFRGYTIQKILGSEDCTSFIFTVRPPRGLQHYCILAQKLHTSSAIYFLLNTKTHILYQKCYSPHGCVGRAATVYIYRQLDAILNLSAKKRKRATKEVKNSSGAEGLAELISDESRNVTHKQDLDLISVGCRLVYRGLVNSNPSSNKKRSLYLFVLSIFCVLPCLRFL